jgi:hypothetical protein
MNRCSDTQSKITASNDKYGRMHLNLSNETLVPCHDVGDYIVCYEVLISWVEVNENDEYCVLDSMSLYASLCFHTRNMLSVGTSAEESGRGASCTNCLCTFAGDAPTRK